jgi:hypothetical protein
MFEGEWLEAESEKIQKFYHDCQDLHSHSVFLSGKLRDILLPIHRYIYIKAKYGTLVGKYCLVVKMYDVCFVSDTFLYFTGNFWMDIHLLFLILTNWLIFSYSPIFLYISNTYSYFKLSVLSYLILDSHSSLLVIHTCSD